jgi:hypothetical protein
LFLSSFVQTHFFTGIYEKLLDEGASTQEIRADYLKLFKDNKCTQRDDASFIDGTPVMHRSQLASKNINEFYSKLGDDIKDEVKFIVMLREPVSRDNSWYEHSTRQYLTGHKTGKGFSDDRRGSIKELKTFREIWWDDITAVKNGKKKRSALGNEIGGGK